MPVQPTYPGVYIEELPSGVRTITGVATSVTAFVGRAKMGPVNEPIRISSFGDFGRIFGGLEVNSMMSYAVQHYFQNAGKDAVIVRVVHSDASKATMDLDPAGGGTFELEAANEGDWGNDLGGRVDHDTSDKDETTPKLFNVTLRNKRTEETETFLNLSTEADHPRFVDLVLKNESNFARVKTTPTTRPAAHPDPTAPITDPFQDDNAHAAASGGGDGSAIDDGDVKGDESNKTGIYALEKTDIFNLLCIPPLTRDLDVGAKNTYEPALDFCKKRRAMLIVDPPSTWNTVAQAESGVDDGTFVKRDENAALFFPRLVMPDASKDNQLEEFVPCGAVAGIMARTDATRGVWKAPAGQDAGLSGVRKMSVSMTDAENGRLNPLGVNALRTFPVTGHVVWGARTLEGADRLASEWKYIPVRRLTLFLEESLYRGTQWVVFEPNDEPLWAQIRLNVGAFMNNLFRQGAFQGQSPREAYLVKCDSETTTQNDINLGIVNILVGFAPLKPAEFVFIKIQQLAGQIET